MSTLSRRNLKTIARLAIKPREEGVRLHRDRSDGRHYATSTSTPMKLYFVTRVSYTCPEFVHDQKCKHLAALTMAVMNEPDDNKPQEVLAGQMETAMDTSAFLPMVEIVHIAGGMRMRAGQYTPAI